MADDAVLDPAHEPLAVGPLIELRDGPLAVSVAPQAGGRLAQVLYGRQRWLFGPEGAGDGAIAWGCYPMVPWAGRVREGRFQFGGHGVQLPPSLGAHAIHGTGYRLPWQVEHAGTRDCLLSLPLGEGPEWPFGGRAEQRIVLDGRRLRLELGMTAGLQPMPRPVLGWHPWFRKPERVEFAPVARYPRDADGIAVLPTVAVGEGPWDDCFINTAPVVLRSAGQVLTLRSDSDHWVVYDEPSHATCVEPQGGPPDAFNLVADVLAPGDSVSTWFEWVFEDEA